MLLEVKDQLLLGQQGFIVQLGHLLKLDIVAEGVESEEIARHLQQLGVRRMQGFYFSEAVPANAAGLMLRLGVTRQLNPP